MCHLFERTSSLCRTSSGKTDAIPVTDAPDRRFADLAFCSRLSDRRFSSSRLRDNFSVTLRSSDRAIFERILKNNFFCSNNNKILDEEYRLWNKGLLFKISFFKDGTLFRIKVQGKKVKLRHPNTPIRTLNPCLVRNFKIESTEEHNLNRTTYLLDKRFF